MDVKLTPEASEDRRELDPGEWERIKSKIEEIDTDLSHGELKLIANPMLDRPIYQLSCEGESQDYRIFLDVRYSILVVIAVFSFEFSHQGDKHWRELDKRN